MFFGVFFFGRSLLPVAPELLTEIEQQNNPGTRIDERIEH